MRRLEMPDEQDLPPGPVRDLALALFELYERAGKPSTRRVEQWIYDANLPGALGRDGVNKALRGVHVPRWRNLEALVTILVNAQLAFHEPRAVDTVLRHINELWNLADASQPARSRLHAGPPKPDSVSPAAISHTELGDGSDRGGIPSPPSRSDTPGGQGERDDPKAALSTPPHRDAVRSDQHHDLRHRNEKSPSPDNTAVIEPKRSREDLVTQLEKELNDLDRGRGVNDPDVSRRLGPALATVLGYSGNDAVPQLDGQIPPIRERLLEAARSLPPDLQRVFLTGLGISTTEQLLTVRLEELGMTMNRGVRTMARYLREANHAVARTLAQDWDRPTPVDTANPFTERGWYVDRLESHAVIGPHHARFTTVRDIVITYDNVSSISESMTYAADATGLVVSPLSGCDMLEVVQFSRSTVRLRIHLPRAFKAHERHRVSLVAQLPTDTLRPHNVLVPARLTGSFHATIAFDADLPIGHVWRYDGVPPPAIEDDDFRPPTELHLGPERWVAADWPSVRQGLAYGIGWSKPS